MPASADVTQRVLDLAAYIGEQTAWHGDDRFFFRAEYIDALRALAPPVPLTRRERYFAVGR